MANPVQNTLGTKAETLDLLRGMGFCVPELVYFSVDCWARHRDLVLEKIRRRIWSEGRLAVRSSAQAEDGAESSLAGRFQSLLGVDGTSLASLATAIDRVAAAYFGGGEDQILVQPMLDDISASGVIMTRCLDDGSPYYVVNYDDASGRTDTITGGTGESKTVYVYNGVRDEDFDSPRLRAMVGLARRVEEVFGGLPLDIEFCLDRNDQAHLLQTRRICTTRHWNERSTARVSETLAGVEAFVRQCLGPKPGLAGRRSILGNMPDWNPAEIIGATPRPLAASLYREIVTRRIWSLARERMGYAAMPPEELMVLVAGRPYIDVRNSFNSFLPPGLEPDTAQALVEAWLDRLDHRPELHDKVEFEVASTLLDFTFDARFAERYPGVLNPGQLADYRSRLGALTRSCVTLSPQGSLARALAENATLESRQAGLGLDFGDDPFAVLVRVRALLEECKRLGTLPFSIIARHAFMAEALLRSAVARGALAPERVEQFKRGVHTVSGDLTVEFSAVNRGELGRAAFLARYGHLRPGTYDILSPRYDARPELFEGSSPLPAAGEAVAFAPTPAERRGLDALLAEIGVELPGAEALFAYARMAIAGREQAKFVFTRNLSAALEGIAAWGRLAGLDREEMSLLTAQDVLEGLYSPPLAHSREHFAGLVERGRDAYALARSVKLSYLIRSPRDVYVVPRHRDAPNFITARRIEAPLAHLGAGRAPEGSLAGRVVCIENADPGYDWIFTKGIAGLVTKYGGTNSHMAIRCAEYGLPAAIGCGEMLFERLLGAERVELNCAEKVLRPLARATWDLA